MVLRADASAEVDDFLGLLDQDLSGLTSLVLRGKSGSGKSTLLQNVATWHPQLSGARVHPIRWHEGAALPPDLAPGDWVLFDEVLGPADLVPLVRLAARGARLLVCSHLPGPAHWVLRPFGPLRVLATDQDLGKLRRWLASRGVACTEAGLRWYRRRYGATYTDLEIILERCPGPSLEASLGRFARHHQIEHQPARERG